MCRYICLFGWLASSYDRRLRSHMLKTASLYQLNWADIVTDFRRNSIVWQLKKASRLLTPITYDFVLDHIDGFWTVPLARFHWQVRYGFYAFPKINIAVKASPSRYYQEVTPSRKSTLVTLEPRFYSQNVNQTTRKQILTVWIDYLYEKVFFLTIKT